MQYYSNEKPKSQVLKQTFINRLNALNGYRIVTNKDKATQFGKNHGLEFVKVNLNSGGDSTSVSQSLLGSTYNSTNLSSSLERYFDAYINETTFSYADVQDRAKRINELTFMKTNDPIVARCVDCVADEATQIDIQTRILNIESPDLAFTKRTYQLLADWGVTPNVLHSACHDLELYGEAFWSQKVTPNGVISIKPIKVLGVRERLEFSPERMAQYLGERDGHMKSAASRSQKLATLIANFKTDANTDYAENFSDFFETKLLGFELEDGNIIPPWLITHFRFDAEHSEFFPYGRPPLLHCLAPFKQCFSTIALQGLARSMAFPITMYKVKTGEGLSPGKAFELVSTVREEYDNIGVSLSSSGSEVYTVNTKIWLPENLLEIDVKESKVDINFIGDLEFHQNRVFIGTGVARGYIDQENHNGYGVSGKSLIEQSKPFSRKIFNIQTSCLEGIGSLIRLHYAITGEFDYNTPFVLSMRLPADEMDEDKRTARLNSLEMASDIMEMIKSTLGIEDSEPLPEDVIIDIMTKYSFLDPTDIQKWLKKASILKLSGNEEDDEDSDSGFGGRDDDFSFDMDSDDRLDDDTGDVEPMEEAKKLASGRKKYLKRLREKEIRLQEITRGYDKNKSSIYLQVLKENNMVNFTKPVADAKDRLDHTVMIPRIDNNSPLAPMLEVLIPKKSSKDGFKLREDISVEEIIESKRGCYNIDPTSAKLNKKLRSHVKAVVNREEDDEKTFLE